MLMVQLTVRCRADGLRSETGEREGETRPPRVAYLLLFGRRVCLLRNGRRRHRREEIPLLTILTLGQK